MQSRRGIRENASASQAKKGGTSDFRTNRPRQPRLDGRDVLVQVVAVQAQTCLEAKAVTRTQAYAAHSSSQFSGRASVADA